MRTGLLAFVLMLSVLSTGCKTAGSTPEDRANTVRLSEAAVNDFERLKPSAYETYNKASVGMAVFPSIGKGGLGVGGAYGRGAVFEDGELTGYCKVEELNYGFQLGGQAITMIMFFENEPALQRFKRGEFALDASASAVIVEADASYTADFKKGVATTTFDSTGLMYQATLGGKRFKYLPADTFD
ncbi:MAG: hypothetical protein KTR15_16440 [Phycisphaeraceae bacterium]|nr:hypothetical protein [Phycisphaeraceae bacterium]